MDQGDALSGLDIFTDLDEGPADHALERADHDAVGEVDLLPVDARPHLGLAEFQGLPLAGDQVDFAARDLRLGEPRSCRGELGRGVNQFFLGGQISVARLVVPLALMAFDFAKAVIDNDIAMMVKRIQRGFEFSEENLALDLIAEVGPGGMFADTDHTLERMRTTMYLTDVADRGPRQLWQESGALDVQTRAMKRVREILTQDNPADFSPEVDAQIRREFIGMVAGESTPPAGWKRTTSSSIKGRESREQRRLRRRQQAVTD